MLWGVINMNYNYYLALVEEAGAYNDKDTFLGAYGYPEGCPYTPENLQHVFYIIYAVSNNDFLEVAGLSGLNFSKFHKKYGIPERTAFSWKNRERQAPPYVLQLIGYAMIAEIEKSEE